MTSELLNAIGLKAVSEQLDDIVAYATKRRLGVQQLLEHIAGIEKQDRARRSLESRIKKSKIGRLKPMSDFDWGWPKKINQTKIESILALDFLKERKNVILVAPQGLGKTMIARNICQNAILAGHSTLFTTAAQLLLDLASQESASGLESVYDTIKDPHCLL